MTTVKKVLFGAVLLFVLATVGFLVSRPRGVGPDGPATMWEALRHLMARRDTTTLRKIDQARDSLVLAITAIDSMFKHRDDSTARQLARTTSQLARTEQQVQQLQTTLAASRDDDDSLESYRNLDREQRLQITQLKTKISLLEADTLSKSQQLNELRASLASALAIAGRYRQAGTYNKWLVMGAATLATAAGCKLVPGEHNPC